ncbi:izumo sperm-egg fusion protein 1 [Arapaima gigas]
MPHAVCFCLLCFTLLLPSASPCLQCDRLVRYLFEDLVLTVPVEDQTDVTNVIKAAYPAYKDISMNYQGVIGMCTGVACKMPCDSDDKTELFTCEFNMYNRISTVKLTQKGELILKKYLGSFVKTGMMLQLWMFNQTLLNCTTCKYEFHPCLSPADRRHCGVLHLEAQEDGQVVLDCFLPWHRLVIEQKEYQFSRSSDISGEFREFLVTPQSEVVLNQLEVDEQGVYQCLLRDSSGMVLTDIQYNLTVKALPLTTLPPVFTIPALTGQDPPSLVYRDLVVAAIAIVMALSLLGSFAIAVSFG